MMVAVDSAQKPPIVMPSSARAAIRTAKFGASAISTSDASISAVSADQHVAPVEAAGRASRSAGW